MLGKYSCLIRRTRPVPANSNIKNKKLREVKRKSADLGTCQIKKLIVVNKPSQSIRSPYQAEFMKGRAEFSFVKGETVCSAYVAI